MKRHCCGAGLALTWLLIIGWGAVAKGQAPEVTIRETYWQTLPDVADVIVDTRGDPWFSVYKLEPREVQKTARLLSADLNVHLIDQRDRIWADFTVDEKPSRRVTGYYDGTTWHERGIHAALVFEDSSGRVYLFDKTHVHVLDTEDQWSTQEVLPVETYVTGHFVEDEAGRTWFWAERFRQKTDDVGTPGLWRSEDGAWTRFDAATGLAFDEIKSFVPLTDERFLVVGSALEHQNKYFVWSPSRKLKEAEVNVFGDLQVLSIEPYLGSDVDGAHWFSINLAPKRPDGETAKIGPSGYGAYGGYHVWCQMSREGKLRLLNRNEQARFQAVPCAADKRYRPVLGRFDDPCAAAPAESTTSAYLDREGRRYFFLRSGQQHGPVGILWPRHAALGEVIRNQDFENEVLAWFQTDDGAVWGTSPYPGGLMRWNGEQWEKTPVTFPRYPDWTARPSPPWSAWSCKPMVFHAGNTVLFVQVRDIYQQMAAEADGKELSNWDIRKLEPEHLDRERDSHWLEAWLFHDGRWTGPMRLKDCLREHRETLAPLLTQRQHDAACLALVGDGKERLWAAYEGNLVAFDRDGMQTWPIPVVAPKEAGGAATSLKKAQKIDAQSPNPAAWDWGTRRAMYGTDYELSNLGDGRMLLSYYGGILTASVIDGKIVAEPFPMPVRPQPLGQNQQLTPGVHVARDQSVWLLHWDGAQQLRNGTWQDELQVNQFLFEDTDGSLWFRAPSPDPRNVKAPDDEFVIVKDGKSRTLKLPIPKDYNPANPTPTIDGRILFVNRLGILELGPLEPNGERPITRTRYFDAHAEVLGPLSRMRNPVGASFPVFESPDGSIFVGTFRGK